MFLQDRNEAEEAKEKSSGLFDPTSETFTKSFNVTVSLLSTAVVAGLIWHFGRYRRRIRKQKKQLEELSKFSIFNIYDFIDECLLFSCNNSEKQFPPNHGQVQNKKINFRCITIN